MAVAWYCLVRSELGENGRETTLEGAALLPVPPEAGFSISHLSSEHDQSHTRAAFLSIDPVGRGMTEADRIRIRYSPGSEDVGAALRNESFEQFLRRLREGARRGRRRVGGGDQRRVRPDESCHTPRRGGRRRHRRRERDRVRVPRRNRGVNVCCCPRIRPPSPYSRGARSPRCRYRLGRRVGG